jgi:hypothetical protein
MADISGLLQRITGMMTYAGLVRADGTEETAAGYKRVPVVMRLSESNGTAVITNRSELRFGPYEVDTTQPIVGVILAESAVAERLSMVDVKVVRRAPEQGHMLIFLEDEIEVKVQLA